MAGFDFAQITLESILAILAWVVARRAREHRAFAWLVTFYPPSDLARFALRHHLLQQPRPFHGWNRVGMHTDVLLYLVWYALLAAIAIHYFLRRRMWPVAVASLVAAVVCLDYPRVSGHVLQNWYRVVTLSALCTAWAAMLLGTASGRMGPPVFAHATFAALALTEITTLPRTLALDAVRQWLVVQYATSVVFVAEILAHVWWISANRNAHKGAE